ncbi:hypothetical protein F5884DRAFT_851423 [Xylogone sp. PMI_703]|nr:hypothetical protein F5884DRAFT_851423 [Xylogone sp. PMI_703]
MHSSRIFVALSAFAAFVSAIPTPVQPAARCGTTVVPTQIAKLDVTTGAIEGINDYFLKQSIIEHVVQSNSIVNFAIFAIPPNKYGCQLVAQFGNDISLADMDLKTFDKQGFLFGTFNLIEDTTQVVNTATCPSNGGFLLFELAFDSSLPASATASFPQNDHSGLFVEYNC